MLTEPTGWTAHVIVDGVVIELATVNCGMLCVGKDGHFVRKVVAGDVGRGKEERAVAFAVERRHEYA